LGIPSEEASLRGLHEMSYISQYANHGSNNKGRIDFKDVEKGVSKSKVDTPQDVNCMRARWVSAWSLYATLGTPLLFDDIILCFSALL
jgi:hypothetical protein